jgi:hypothetical protein
MFPCSCGVSGDMRNINPIFLPKAKVAQQAFSLDVNFARRRLNVREQITCYKQRKWLRYKIWFLVRIARHRQ